MTAIKILEAPEEVRSWTRRVRLEWKGTQEGSNKTAYVVFHYDEGDSYSFNDPSYFGEGWTDAERQEFHNWLRSEEGAECLDELTSYPDSFQIINEI